MAFCKNCGAYIPDGQNVCVACGVKEGAAQQQKQDFREILEEKQKAQQEANKKWAEDAYKDYKQNSTHKTSTSAYAAEHKTNTNKERKKPREESMKTFGKVLSILSYVSVCCFLPFFFTKDDEFTKFHGKQGILLLILSAIIAVLRGIPGVPFVLGAFRIYLMYVGIKNVLNNKMEVLPYIGKYAEKF